MQVIVIQSRKDCLNPGCKFPFTTLAEIPALDETTKGHNLECPKCHFEFCSQCFEPIDEGDGNSVKCPDCNTILKLPES